MSASDSKFFYSSLGNYLFSILITSIVFVSCSDVEPDFNKGEKAYTAENLIKPEVWLSEAYEFAEKVSKDTAIVSKTIGTISSSDHQRSLFYDRSGSIVKLELITTENIIQNYFFDKGKLVFSFHKLPGDCPKLNVDGIDCKQIFVIAYANQVPFSSAGKIIKIDGSIAEGKLEEFKAVNLNELPNEIICNHDIIRRKLDKLQSISRNSDSPIRISLGNKQKKKFQLQDQEQNLVVETKKGERLKIKLDSNNPNLYFRLSPNNGSVMEYRNWQGSSPVDGDFWINVFTLNEQDQEANAMPIDYTLSVDNY